MIPSASQILKYLPPGVSPAAGVDFLTKPPTIPEPYF